MKVGVLGTGMVGNAIATRLSQGGRLVMMGSRTANNEKARAWVKTAGKNASQGTFADAAKYGEIIFNCTSGSATLEALQLAGAQNLAGKVLIDVANPLDFPGACRPRSWCAIPTRSASRSSGPFPAPKS